jgi:hypothetical protein
MEMAKQPSKIAPTPLYNPMVEGNKKKTSHKQENIVDI